VAFFGAEDVMVDLYLEQQYEQEEWEARQQSLQEEVWAAEQDWIDFHNAEQEAEEWEDFQDFEPLHDEYPF
jgi:hypothetical protein